jgi:hypothetical protein
MAHMACPLHSQPSGAISTEEEVMESAASPSLAGMQSWFRVVCVRDEAQGKERREFTTHSALQIFVSAREMERKKRHVRR